MYGQLTTGRPMVVVSKTGKGLPAWRLEVRIDARTNKPEVLNKPEGTVGRGPRHDRSPSR
jgi:DNA topoisomerase-6 subunit B